MSCGISKAGFLEQEAPRLENWLNKNQHGQMSYMENNFDKRLNPTLLVDGAKSVVSLLLNYYPSEIQNQESYKISKYAYGQDYHSVIKDKLKELLYSIQENIILKIYFLLRVCGLFEFPLSPPLPCCFFDKPPNGDNSLLP